MNCYCGSQKSFQECCEKFHTEAALPSTSEELMRSRYSAFATKNINYIFATIDPQNRMEFDREANTRWAEQAQFTGLEILRTEDSGNKGLVEFKASYTIEGTSYVHHEISTFRKQAGRWFYKSGKILAKS